MPDYKRSCEDEIDFAVAEQLHGAALQISKACFDLKKLCVAFLGASMALLIKFTGNEIDHSLFVVGLLLIIGFWVSDATAYFYQRSLRTKIDARFLNIAKRHEAGEVTADSSVGVCQALINWSMSLYCLLTLLFLTGWASYVWGVIG